MLKCCFGLQNEDVEIRGVFGTKECSRSRPRTFAAVSCGFFIVVISLGAIFSLLVTTGPLFGVKEPREWSKSRIIQGDHEAQKKLTVYLDPVQDGKKTWELCFRASEHQYSAYAFHAYCDHRGPTVTLVRVGKDVFGGYADKSWEGDDGHFTYSTAAFLFQLKSPLSARSYKLPAYRNHHYALYSARKYGPTFGGGMDLRLDDRCNINTTLGVTASYSNLGFTFQLPVATTRARSLLAGSYIFECDEYEVFYQTEIMPFTLDSV